MKAVTHYDPYGQDEEDYTEVAMCGTRVGENYEYSNNWLYVSCKKCLKNQEQYKKQIEDEQKHRSEQDGDFVDFCIKTGFYNPSITL